MKVTSTFCAATTTSDSRFMSRELNNIYLDCLVCLLTGEQTEPLAGANVRAQHRVMDTSIERWRAGCIQAGGSPRGRALRGLKLSLCLPTDCSDWTQCPLISPALSFWTKQKINITLFVCIVGKHTLQIIWTAWIGWMDYCPPSLKAVSHFIINVWEDT